MAQIKTYEAACKELKLDPKALPDVSTLPEKHRKAIIAHFKLVIIAEALNEGWTPDWSDYDQAKYYPWFEVIPDNKSVSGFGLSYGAYGGWLTGTGVGSHLCFKTRDLAKYAGKQFLKLYEEYMLL